MVVYAWNATGSESRGEIALCSGCAVGIDRNTQPVARNAGNSGMLFAAVQSSHGIRFTFEPRQTAALITVVGLDGRCVARMDVSGGSGSFLWNRAKLTPGIYMAMLQRRDGCTARMRIVIP